MAAVLLFTACGGGDKVSPEAFAKDVCSAVGKWVGSIQDKASSLGSALTGEPAQAKEKLDEFLGQAVDATDELIASVDDAGVPDVDGGEDLANDLSDTFEKAKEALEETRGKVADLPEDDPQAFSQQASELGNEIQTTMGNLGDSLGDAPDELTQAFQDEEGCQQIAG